MRLIELAQECMTEEGFALLMDIDDQLPDIWDKPSSSTLKYHKKSDGGVPSIEDHTYEMLYAATKIIALFGYDEDPKRRDAIYFAIIMHDGLKYGPGGYYKHTMVNHHRLIAEFLEGKRRQAQLKKYFSGSEYRLIIEMVRYHSGRWSVLKAERPAFEFEELHTEVLFIHMLDMLSTYSCLKEE